MRIVLFYFYRKEKKVNILYLSLTLIHFRSDNVGEALLNTEERFASII